MCVFRALSSDIIGLFSRPAFNCIFLAHIQLFLKCDDWIYFFCYLGYLHVYPLSICIKTSFWRDFVSLWLTCSCILFHFTFIQHILIRTKQYFRYAVICGDKMFKKITFPLDPHGGALVSSKILFHNLEYTWKRLCMFSYGMINDWSITNNLANHMLLLRQYNGFLCNESFRRFNLQSKLAHVLHIRGEKSSTRMYFFSEPDYTMRLDPTLCYKKKKINFASLT